MATLRQATKTTVAPVATTTTEQKIAPKLRTKLLGYLRLYADVSAQMKELKVTKADATAAVRKVREQLGVDSLQLEGFTMTDVGGESFDKAATIKKLQTLYGLTIEQINAAWVVKPKKRFEKITVPGVGDDNGDE